jgi:hypothetical protein
VGDAIELDERASANLMGWLAGHRLVCEVDDPEQVYCDPYTTASLTLTARGRAFADTGVVPEAPGLDWPTAMDNLTKRL